MLHVHLNAVSSCQRSNHTKSKHIHTIMTSIGNVMPYNNFSPYDFRFFFLSFFMFVVVVVFSSFYTHTHTHTCLHTRCTPHTYLYAPVATTTRNHFFHTLLHVHKNGKNAERLFYIEMNTKYKSEQQLWAEKTEPTQYCFICSIFMKFLRQICSTHRRTPRQQF